MTLISILSRFSIYLVHNSGSRNIFLLLGSLGQPSQTRMEGTSTILGVVKVLGARFLMVFSFFLFFMMFPGGSL